MCVLDRAGKYTYFDVAQRMAVASVSGAAAASATYCWRSPIDTLYKQSLRWRAADAPLLSLKRFITSPRGLKAVAIGAVTWTAYDSAIIGLKRFQIVMEETLQVEPEGRDENALVIGTAGGSWKT